MSFQSSCPPHVTFIIQINKIPFVLYILVSNAQNFICCDFAFICIAFVFFVTFKHWLYILNVTLIKLCSVFNVFVAVRILMLKQVLLMSILQAFSMLLKGISKSCLQDMAS